MKVHALISIKINIIEVLITSVEKIRWRCCICFFLLKPNIFKDSVYPFLYPFSGDRERVHSEQMCYERYFVATKSYFCLFEYQPAKAKTKKSTDVNTFFNLFEKLNTSRSNQFLFSFGTFLLLIISFCKVSFWTGSTRDISCCKTLSENVKKPCNFENLISNKLEINEKY